MLREYEECRVKRTLVTVNLVSRRLVINRCWRGIDRYLLTVDDSTFSRVDTLCIIDGSFIFSSLLAERSVPREKERERKRDLSWARQSTLFRTCSRVWASFRLINEPKSLSLSLSLFRLAIRREAWRKDR